MKGSFWGAAAAAALLFLMLHATAAAHVICGDRVFPATLTMDDPGVGDELSLPTITSVPTSSGTTYDYGYELDKRITSNTVFIINGDYFTQAGQGLSGWNNTSLTFKYELPCDADHELAWSLGVVRELPGTGALQLRSAGAIDTVGNTSPTLYVGKGLGDLPVDVLRPLAITTEVGRQLSDSPGASPSAWAYAVSLQYSMPYLQQHVKALKLPQFVTRLTPLVEYAMNSPDAGTPTGTIAPGLLYEANTWQLGAEVLIPANATTRQMQGTGFLVQFHLFLDDAAWKTFWGRPIFGKESGK